MSVHKKTLFEAEWKWLQGLEDDKPTAYMGTQ
jgi:hypothetical protein